MTSHEKECKGCGTLYTPRHEKDHRCKGCYSKQGKRISRRGRDNERDFAKRFESSLNQAIAERNSYRVRRTPMSGALQMDFPADIYFPTLPNWSILRSFHIDTKIAENWHPERWWREEKELCNKVGSYFQKVVIVMRKPKGTINYALLKWDDLEKLILEIEGYRKEENDRTNNTTK